MKYMRIKALLLLVAVIFVTGCIHSETIIHLSKDGSGTIEITTMMSRELIDMFSEFEADKDEPFNESEFKKLEEEFGPGTKLVSYKKKKTKTHIGGVGEFSFPDINLLKVGIIQKGDGGEDEVVNGDDFVRFEYQKRSGKGYLIIIMPEEKGPDTEEEKGNQLKEAQMMKKFLEDMFVSFKVRISGKIISTNAQSVKGSDINLIHLDFSKIVKDEALFLEFMESNGRSEEFDNEDGVFMEQKKTISVEFK